MAEKTRSYSIKVIDVASGKDVLTAIANWTNQEKHVAVAQIARLAGVPPEAANLFAEEVAPKAKPPRRNH